jgi:hypothetical protein
MATPLATDSKAAASAGAVAMSTAPVAGSVATDPVSAGPRVIVLDAGAALVKGVVGGARSSQLYDLCEGLYESRGPIAHHGTVSQIMGQSSHRGRYLLCFENSTDLIPAEMQRWAAEAMACASRQCPAIPCPPARYVPSRINVILYPVGSALGPHMDNHDGWVCILSIGCAIRFMLQVCGRPKRNNPMAPAAAPAVAAPTAAATTDDKSNGHTRAAADPESELVGYADADANANGHDDAEPVPGPVHRFVVESGDALIFNGDSDWRVLHAVEAVVPDTAPTDGPHALPTLRTGRISVQLRGLFANDSYSRSGSDGNGNAMDAASGAAAKAKPTAVTRPGSGVAT